MAHLRNNPASNKPWEVLLPPHYPSQTQPAETPQEGDHPSPEPPSLPQTLDSSPSVDSLFIRICSRPSLTSRTCLDPADSRPSPCSAQGLCQRCRECQGTVGEGPGLPARTTVRGEGPRDRHCLSTRSMGPAITRSCCLLQGVGTGARSHPGSPGKACDKFSWRPRCLCRELTE